MEATKQTVIEQYQDRCVELEQRLADASEAINLIHDVIGTGGNGSETFTSIARRAVRKHESIRDENGKLREALTLAVTHFIGTGRTSKTVDGEAGRAADTIHAALAGSR